MFARVIFSSWMLGAVIVAGTQASDRFSAWVIQDVTNGQAKNIAADLAAQGAPAGLEEKEIVALIAYLQSLGQMARQTAKAP